MRVRFSGLLSLALATATFLCGMQRADADIVISEFMYSGANGEFIEFTNIGPTSVNMSGWSFDDDSRIPFTVDLSSFGIVASGESVVLSEILAADFRTAWGLSASVKVIGGLTSNLGRNDEINLFNAAGDLADRLTFGDQNFPGTIRAQNFSGNPGSDAIAGTNNISGWVLSANGDSFGSFVSVGGDVANPGLSTLTAVPEPGTFLLLGVASSALFGIRKLRRNRSSAKRYGS